MYNTVYGRNAGSTYFSFIDLGNIFEKDGFTENDGNIENLLNPLDGWRLPTETEFIKIIGKYRGTTYRNGSSVNGNAAKHWASIRLDGITLAGQTISRGLLIFPDNKIITGKSISYFDLDDVEFFDNYNAFNSIELNEYIEQGCVFLPAVGGIYDDWEEWNEFGHYLTSTNGIRYLYGYDDLCFQDESSNDFCASVLLVK